MEVMQMVFVGTKVFRIYEKCKNSGWWQPRHLSYETYSMLAWLLNIRAGQPLFKCQGPPTGISKWFIWCTSPYICLDVL